jgi:hypothetical protein
MLCFRSICPGKFEKPTSSGVFLFSSSGMRKWRDDSRDDEKKEDLHRFQVQSLSA